jgi:hypothetical protein
MGMGNLGYGLAGFTLSSMHPRSAQYAMKVVMAGQKARSAVFAPDVPAIHV